MTFLIAETFTDSLSRLTAEEQKAAKMTVAVLSSSAIGEFYLRPVDY